MAPTRRAEAGGVAQDMQAYYARRAAYYERVYFKPERQTDLRAMEAWLPPLCRPPCAGSGLRHRLVDTARRARRAHWLATDLNPETMAWRVPRRPAGLRGVRDRGRLHAGGLGRSFDAAFAGCWWSHVPLAAPAAAGWTRCTRGCSRARAW
jgi:hypothetical protein